MTIRYICVHLVHFSSFGIMHQEKSGNPDYSHTSVESEAMRGWEE
jgi:hypothetical protein